MRQPWQINLSCGQTDLHPESLAAMGQQFGSPIYYPDYRALEVETIQMVRQLLHTNSEIVLMDGSATYGVEAAILSVIEPGNTFVAVVTGVFGQVLADVGRIHGAVVVEQKKPLGQSATADEVAVLLREHPQTKLVAVVHSETSAGTLNPISAIGAVVRDHPETLFMVDAVSSFGGMPIDVDGWGIDLLVTSPQKCMNGPQGIAIVAVSDRAWSVMERRRTPIPSLCQDLTVWRQYHREVRAAHETGSVADASFKEEGKAAHGPSPSYSLIRGFYGALQAVLAEGPENVYHRHRLAGRAARAAVKAMGLSILAESDEVASPTETHIVFPSSVEKEALARAMLRRGVALAGFRMGTMGFVAHPNYLIPAVHALEESLIELGCPIDRGKGVEAACATFAAGEA